MARRKPSAFRELLAYLPQAALLGIARVLPYRARLGFAAWVVGRLVAWVPDLRRRVDGNLARVFPEKPPAERDRIRRAMADRIGRTMIETVFMGDFQARAAWSPPGGPGWPVVERNLAEGRGLLLVSGHFGQWEAVRGLMKARGVEVGALYRPVKNRYVQRVYKAGLETGGRPLFTRDRGGLRELMRHLRGGGLVAVLADQYVFRGAPLDFLGHPAPTGTMIAELAVKFRVPMVPVYATRAEDGLHVAIEFEAPIPEGPPEAMMQALNDSLGARIRARPEQYLWLHRRWSKTLEP